MTTTSIPKTFEQMALKTDIIIGLNEMGITTPAPVQSASFAIVSQGQDLIIQSKTGSGKTLAFGLPGLQMIDPQQMTVQMLVVVPTRELAEQVSAQLQRAGSYLHVGSAPIYGGVPLGPQVDLLLFGPQIVVGTPGRLLDLLKNNKLNLNTCKLAVLDEADEMLDMGFRPDLEYILSYLPREHQTVLCSATMPPAIKAIAQTYMHNPRHLAVGGHRQTMPNTIRHSQLPVPTDQDKPQKLVDLLSRLRPPLTFIFCRTKTETRTVGSFLKRKGFSAATLHGDMDQDARNATMALFKSGACNILVATDVAARGLDIDDVTHVINYSVPPNAEIYVHRTGRTGRIGKSGLAITLVSAREKRDMTLIEETLKARHAGQPEATPRPQRSSAPRRPRTSRPPARA